MHPLAEDRHLVYRYSGGDTVITMRVGGRELPIVRVLVEPRADAPLRTVAFTGELELDATRHTLVRMRGRLVTVRTPPRSVIERAFSVGRLESIAFVELENGEFEGEFWLPTYQRIEAQAAWTMASDSRSVFRILSRYRRHRVNDTTVFALIDTLLPQPYRLSFAPTDSLATFARWRQELGTMTSHVHADDFDDLAPDAWRTTGRPSTRFRVQRFMDAFHANRVEGLFTGLGIEHRFRDQIPGLVLHANGGWAWSEHRVRGRASAALTRGRATYVLRVGRTLDNTNDFRSAFDSGNTLAALFSFDDYDYVDRRLAAAGVVRQWDRVRSVWRLETGPARDAGVVRTLSRGVFRADSGFRENRTVRGGSYWRTWTALEWHPDVSAEFMRPGLGATLQAEHAAGTLDYLRLEGRLVARQNRGPITLAARFDAGLLRSDAPPPQQLFELGRSQNLHGYNYKQFVGQRAAVARTMAMVRIPLLRAPIRLGRWFLPSPSPAFAASAQSAWSDLEGAGATRASEELWMPAPRATGGIRSSVTLGLRFFGGALGVGFVRAVDRASPWTIRWDFGQIL